MKNRTIEIHESKGALAIAAADRIVNIVNMAIRTRGECHLVLSGGSTPADIFRTLASDDYRSKIDWSKVFFYWGDERTVPPDDADSNFRMANDTMLSPVHVPENNIVRMRGELEPEAAANAYQQELQDRFPDSIPAFDLIMLGMGDDGHTASLFPQTTAVDENERLVTSVFVDKLNTWRITFTLVLINNARTILFLVAGSSKAGTVKKVLTGTPSKSLPSTLVSPHNGELVWMLDKNAASLIQQ